MLAVLAAAGFLAVALGIRAVTGDWSALRRPGSATTSRSGNPRGPL